MFFINIYKYICVLKHYICDLNVMYYSPFIKLHAFTVPCSSGILTVVYITAVY